MNARHVALVSVLMSLVASGAWAQEGEEAAPAEDAPKAEKPAEGDEAEAAEGEDEAAKEEGGEAEGTPPAEPQKGGVLGPGGKPLRTDYPGTPESLQPRMDTQQIQGLEVDPNQPQAAYGLRIRELETKIDDLKEKVFQSKTRIVLLRETLLSGNLAGARAIIVHKTELGSAWKLDQAYYALDGTKLLSKSDVKGTLSDDRIFQVYDGSVAPGNHNLSVLVKYRGTNVGIFPYFKGYDGDIRSSCDFRAKEGKVAQVVVSVYPNGGITESIENRPLVKCEVAYFDNIRQESGEERVETQGKTSDEPAAEAQ